jgi:hypothetical protein
MAIVEKVRIFFSSIFFKLREQITGKLLANYWQITGKLLASFFGNFIIPNHGGHAIQVPHNN